MGAVTARAAGVDEVVVAAPGHPLILAAAELCGVDAVYRMGGAQAIAALAYGTETIRRVDVIVGPGSLWVQEAKRQVSGVVGIDGFAGPSDLTVIASGDADPAPLRLDLLAQAEHGEGSLTVAVSDDAALLDALPGIDGAGRRHGGRAGVRGGAGARAPAARGRRRRGAGAARAQRRLPVRRHRVRHRVRRLRGRLEPHAAHRAAPRASPPASRRATSGAAWPRSASGPRPRRWRVPARRSRAPRASSTTPPRWRSARIRVQMTRTAQITRKTGETDVTLTLGLAGTGAGTRNTGVGFLDHMLDLLARHGRLDLEVQVDGDLETGAPPHRRGHRDRVRPGARPRARRAARDRALRPRRRADGRGARGLHDRHLRPPVRRRSRASSGCRPATSRASSTSSRRSSSAPWPPPPGSRCTSSSRPAPTPTT